MLLIYHTTMSSAGLLQLVLTIGLGLSVALQKLDHSVMYVLLDMNDMWFSKAVLRWLLHGHNIPHIPGLIRGPDCRQGWRMGYSDFSVGSSAVLLGEMKLTRVLHNCSPSQLTKGGGQTRQSQFSLRSVLRVQEISPERVGLGLHLSSL